MSRCLLRGSWACRSVTVITVESQIHGYRQGHQLLGASVSLSKQDQAVVDRLSDIAGPLRSGETFSPYLSAYPLPSGAYYVLARTWQDFSVPRAGCVRTLSLLIPTDSWSSTQGVQAFWSLLQLQEPPTIANRIEISKPIAQPLPPIPSFQGNELLEALFLETPRPVAVFDAPNPELIALRLITALWPSIRNRFAISTFVLSPRRIEGRDFDLVFAPRSARSRFADWSGRRIDGSTVQKVRHRWTGAIADRVFSEPFPRLLSDREVEVSGGDETDAGAALRIALLWDELLEKLDRTPTAVLGLLDIANSRKQIDPNVLSTLKSILADAAFRAVETLPGDEAWQFISALARKVDGTLVMSEMISVASAAGTLAGSAPSGAVALLEQPLSMTAMGKLVPAIANGLAVSFGKATELALLSAPPQTLAHLLAAGGSLVKTVANTPSLINLLGQILPSLAPSHFREVKRVLLPLLISDSQLDAARPFLATLEPEELLAEVHHLAQVNDFEARSYFVPIVERARQASAIVELREVLLSVPTGSRSDEFLFSTLTPSVEDVTWLVSNDRLSTTTVETFLVQLLRSASTSQLHDLFRRPTTAEVILTRLPASAWDILFLAVFEPELSLSLLVACTLRLLPVVDSQQQIKLASNALERILPEWFGENEESTIFTLLDMVGETLNGKWAVQCGLGGSVAPQIISRNIIAFNKTSGLARVRIVEVVDEIAQALEGRNELCLSADGAHAFVEILWSAEKANLGAYFSASGRLIPLLFRSTQWPVSSVVSATFPIVYRELVKSDDAPNFLIFIPLFSWGKSKAARYDLVNAFINSSVWSPYDLALAACLCSDVDRILRRVSKSIKGDAYLNRLVECIPSLPSKYRQQVERAILKIRSENLGFLNPLD